MRETAWIKAKTIHLKPDNLKWMISTTIRLEVNLRILGNQKFKIMKEEAKTKALMTPSVISINLILFSFESLSFSVHEQKTEMKFKKEKYS